eukprot:SAG31_NODE_29631_length_392_cov_0.860068_1_plen_88_part_01
MHIDSSIKGNNHIRGLPISPSKPFVTLLRTLIKQSPAVTTCNKRKVARDRMHQTGYCCKYYFGRTIYIIANSESRHDGVKFLAPSEFY